MTFDVNEEFNQECNQLIEDIKSFPLNSRRGQKDALRQRVDRALDRHSLPADKAGFLVNILEGAEHCNLAVDMTIPHLSEVYPQIEQFDSQVFYATYVSKCGKQLHLDGPATDFLKASYKSCSDNDTKFRALGCFLMDGRDLHDHMSLDDRVCRFDDHQRYFREWETYFKNGLGSDKSNWAFELYHCHTLYDGFKSNLQAKIFNHLDEVEDPFRQMELIALSNRAWKGLRTEPEVYPSSRIDGNYWPETGLLDWPGALYKACEAASAEKGRQSMLDHLYKKTQGGIQPWLRRFSDIMHAKEPRHPGIRKFRENIHDDPSVSTVPESHMSILQYWQPFDCMGDRNEPYITETISPGKGLSPSVN